MSSNLFSRPSSTLTSSTHTVAETSIEEIRDQDAYPGVRSKITGALSAAEIRFRVDIDIDDPVWPKPFQVELPRLLGTAPLRIKGYAVDLILAEKIVTAFQRGIANTRWRDFVDIAALSTVEVVPNVLGEALRKVADHRQTTIQQLSSVLDDYATPAQLLGPHGDASNN
jgi:hypothetical protein